MILSERDRSGFIQNGWIRLRSVAPKPLCNNLLSALQKDMNVPIDDPARWNAYGTEGKDRIAMWGHQAQWDIRQSPAFYSAWTDLWQDKALLVTLDSCRFTPPWQPGFPEPYPIHIDVDPWNDRAQTLQGVIALRDTSADQGGFRCVPSLYQDRNRWPKQKVKDATGKEFWRPDVSSDEIVHIAAEAGDLIAWSSRLPHSNSKNLSDRPRIAFYAATILASRSEHVRPILTESWSTGNCVPWWRDRLGFNKTEPWPPANLTSLGRRLVGLDAWS